MNHPVPSLLKGNLKYYFGVAGNPDQVLQEMGIQVHVVPPAQQKAVLAIACASGEKVCRVTFPVSEIPYQ